jgi:hypothetical protein
MSPDFKRIIVLWQNAIVFQGSILLIHFRHVSGVKHNSRWRKKYMFFWEPFWQICLTEILEWNFAWNTRLKKFVNCNLIKSAPRGNVAASRVNKSIRTRPMNIIWNCWNFVKFPINVLHMYHWEKSLLRSDVFRNGSAIIFQVQNLQSDNLIKSFSRFRGRKASGYFFHFFK